MPDRQQGKPVGPPDEPSKKQERETIEHGATILEGII